MTPRAVLIGMALVAILTVGGCTNGDDERQLERPAPRADAPVASERQAEPLQMPDDDPLLGPLEAALLGLASGFLLAVAVLWDPHASWRTGTNRERTGTPPPHDGDHPGRRRSDASPLPPSWTAELPQADSDGGTHAAGASVERLANQRRRLVKALIDGRDRVDSPAIAQSMQRALADVGVHEVAPSPGSPFDPSRHMVTRPVPTEDAGAADTIAALETPGYVDDGSLLRYARVQVHHYREPAR